MNQESLRQTLRVHVMRLRQQYQRQQPNGPFSGCTVDELVQQVEGVLSTDKPDYGFAEALAQLQALLGGATTASPTANASVPMRRGSIGSGLSEMIDISEIIDADALISRHSLKTLA